MRAFGSLVAVAVLVTASQSQAAAAPPEREPEEPLTFRFDAGLVCEFPVSGDPLINRRVRTTFVDEEGQASRVHLTGRLVYRFTNETTGESVVRNVSGPEFFTQLYPDGSPRVFVTHGPQYIPFFPGEIGPEGALVVVYGTARVRIEDTGAFTVLRRTGRQENVCDTLAA